MQTLRLFASTKKHPYDRRVDKLLTMFMDRASSVYADADAGNEYGLWKLCVHMDGAVYELLMDDEYHEDMSVCHEDGAPDTIYRKVRPSRVKEAEFRNWLDHLGVAPPTAAPWLPKLDRLVGGQALTI